MDPKRRLQVLNSASPSIRLAAAPAQPQQKLNVSTAQPTQNISISTPKGVQTVKPSTSSAPISSGQEPHHFGLGDIVKSVADPYNRLSSGIAESLAYGTKDQTDARNASLNLQQQQTGLIRQATQKLNDPNVGIAEKQRWQKILSDNANNASETYANATNRNQQIIDRTDPVKGAAAVASIGSDVLTGGMGIEGGAEVKAAFGKGLTSEAVKTAAGIAAKNGAIGLPGGVADAYMQNGNKTTLGQVLKSGATSFASAAAIPLVSGAVRGIFKIPHASDVGLSTDEIKFIKKTNDPQQIHTLLSSLAGGDTQGLQELSQKLAGTKSTKEIVHAIENLPIEAGATGVASSLVSNAVAKGKYGEGPLTGESAPRVAPPEPEKVVPLGPQDPNAPDPNSIPLTGTALDQPLPQEMISHAEQTAGVVPQPTEPLNFSERLAQKQAAAAAPTAEDKIRMSPINENAKDVMVHPNNRDAITHGILNTDPNATSTDALSTVVNALAHSPNKGEVRDMINGLFHDKATGKSVLEGNDLNRIVKDVTKSTDPEEIKQHLATALDNHDAKAAAPVTEKQVADTTAKTETGTSDGNGNVLNEDGSVSTPGRQFNTSDTGVSEQVNKSADTVAPVDENATIAYKNKNGNTRTSIYKDIKSEIDTLHEEAAQKGGLSDAKQKRLEELQSQERVIHFNAEAAFPGLKPEEHKAVQEVMDSLNDGLHQYDDAAKARAAERAKKFGKGTGAYESAGGGEAGFQAKLGSMRGKLTQSSFEAINASPEAKDTILNTIEDVGKGNGMLPGEILNTQQAMRKVWGTAEGKPTPSDIRNIRSFFGDSMADLVDQAVKQSPKDWREKLAEIPGFFKTTASTGDLSGGFRQAGVLGSGHPVLWAQAQLKSLKYVKSPAFYESEMKKLGDDPIARIGMEHGLDLPAASGSKEEQYMGDGIATKIPVFKHVVNGSERAYDGLLTELRANVFKDLYTKMGGEAKMTKQDLKDLAEVINTASGRGGKKGGLVDTHAKTLSTTLFSPRLWASRLNQLNPYYYARLTPVARKEALRNAAAFASVASTVLIAAKASGFDVETDARSSDFLKIKKGNTRYDILGGFQQNIVFAWREISGEYKSSTSGNVSSLTNPKFGGADRVSIASDMGTNKLNPLLGTALHIWKGKDRGGNPINPYTELGKLFIPLNLQGLYSSADDAGNLKDPMSWGKGALANVPATFGVGVQTYGATKSKDQGKVLADGTTEFKGKVTPDMVTDDSGKPILDKKGIPVKVTVPAGATQTEIQALKDEKKQSALKDQYTRSLSGEDQALLKRSDSELKQYVKDGTISQAKYDTLTTERQKQSAIGKSDDAVSVPDGLDGAAANFYKKYNSLSKDQKAEFTKHGATTPESQALVDELNNNPNNPEDVPKLSKGNNQLAKLYADYKADLIKNKGSDTLVDQQNKAKKFWTEAIKTQHDSVAQDLYSEGNSADFKALVNEGKIKQSQVDAAIALDDALYKTGFVGLKFGKKFREEWGYKTPTKTTSGKHSTGSSSSSSSGGSSSGSTASINAHLDSLLIPTTTGQSKSGVPSFSARKRNIQFKASGAVPQASSGKKVAIKL